MRGVSWSVLALVAGLFVLVEGLIHSGLIPLLSHALRDAASARGKLSIWRALPEGPPRPMLQAALDQAGAQLAPGQSLVVRDAAGQPLVDPSDPTRYVVKSVPNDGTTVIPSIGVMVEF